MAKTFKNLPLSNIEATNKRPSERDFFDLTDITLSAGNSEAVPDDDNTDNISLQCITDNLSVTRNISNIGNQHTRRNSNSASDDDSGNTRNSISIGNADNPTSALSSKNSAGKVLVSGDARQTFVLSQNHLEQLRDHVHARRAGGDYTYSQKQAMQEALDLLFASTAPVAPRPDQAREREQQRRERIQQGRQSRV